MNKGRLKSVWGGQWGSEGKGQVAKLLTNTMYQGTAVRVGGPNAGHSFYPNGPENTPEVVQVLPVASVYRPNLWDAVIGAAGVIDLQYLSRELMMCAERTNRFPNLMIDRFASIITEEDVEKEAHLRGAIASTGKGVGAATAAKVMRMPKVVASHEENTNRLNVHAALMQSRATGDLRLRIMDTVYHLNQELMAGGNVMIEGTQGYGLSLHTGGYYPFCTSRECTPQALLSQTGVNPNRAEEVESIMVLRTFPIRVGGNSGPLPNEIDWDTLKEETEGYVWVPERTTVTKTIRRIARFDYGLPGRAVMQCSPDALALTFLDYRFPYIAGCKPIHFTNEIHAYLYNLGKNLRTPVRYVSTGPGHTYEYRGASL